jgi:hypothetical protein
VKSWWRQRYSVKNSCATFRSACLSLKATQQNAAASYLSGLNTTVAGSALAIPYGNFPGTERPTCLGNSDLVRPSNGYPEGPKCNPSSCKVKKTGRWVTWIRTPPVRKRSEEKKARIYREHLIFLSNARNPIAARKIPKSKSEDPQKVKRFHFRSSEKTIQF